MLGSSSTLGESRFSLSESVFISNEERHTLSLYLLTMFSGNCRLQHTDTDVPHFTDDDHNFVKGAFHTIDRPYDKLDPWGVIDFLHHKIGTTHVAHHFDSTIPHYKAQVATDAIIEAFPDIYLYDPTPIPEALWRVCKGCASVEKRGDYFVWNNQDVDEKLLKVE